MAKKKISIRRITISLCVLELAIRVFLTAAYWTDSSYHIRLDVAKDRISIEANVDN